MNWMGDLLEHSLPLGDSAVYRALSPPVSGDFLWEFNAESDAMVCLQFCRYKPRTLQN